MLSSSSSATVRVDKATSDLLIGPDWPMNIDICDSINSNPWQAKDVVKAVKKRLQHKNPKVHLLALTLLETMVKNCGDNVHLQIVEKNILQEMIKIVRKKADMHVRDKILILLDSWQEAFGGPGGKYPQYYWAYEELRRSGVEFPQRSSDAAPIFTPPVTHPVVRHAQLGYGMPSNASTRLDEAMASETEALSSSSLDSMVNVMEVLSDMLRAVNPGDSEAAKDEVIVDLVAHCRANQKRLMQMLASTGDEGLLGRGLELNDSLQSLLANYDAIASGLSLPTPVMNFSPQPNSVSASSLEPTEVSHPNVRSIESPSGPVASRTMNEVDEEEDDFALLARRHLKQKSVASPSASTEFGEGSSSLSNGDSTASTEPATLIPSQSNALALPDPPAPVRTTKEQDMIDLLSLTLSTTSTSPHTPYTPHTPPAHVQNMQQVPVSPPTQGNNPYVYPGNQREVTYNSYVAPWAQPQPQPQPQRQLQQQPQPQQQPPSQPQYPQYGYPPPPWAATPGYSSNPTTSYKHMQGSRPLQQFNSLPSQGNGAVMHGGLRMSSNPSATGQKPFIPSYRLFEDLNVLGNSDSRLKVTSSDSPSLSGSSGQSMVGGKK